MARVRTGRPAHRPRRAESVCGTVQAYWRGCRCDGCRKGERDYQRKLSQLKRSLKIKRNPKPITVSAEPRIKVERMMAIIDKLYRMRAA